MGLSVGRQAECTTHNAGTAWTAGETPLKEQGAFDLNPDGQIG
jgi:hypothetical protein